MTGVVALVPRSRRGGRSEGFLRRRTGLIAPAVMIAIAIALVIGIVTMDVPENVAFPGPQVFPSFVAVGCVVFAVLLAIDVIRHPEPADVAPPESVSLAASASTDALDAEELALLAEIETEDDPAAGEAEVRTRSNHLALWSAVAVFVIFIVALQPVGWLISGAFLFWGIAWALGSKRAVFDIFLAIAISSLIQLAFSAGLGLNLPPGFLAGVI